MARNWKDEIRDLHVLTEMLPPGLPRPQFQEPDQETAMAGMVWLEWWVDSDNLFTIWMEEGCVSFAGRFEGKDASGHTSQHCVIPDTARETLRKVTEKMRARGEHQTISNDLERGR